MKLSEGIVFLGPSLPRAEAKRVLPGANYAPPVRIGDILGALKYAPRFIAIVDGYFGNTPSIWHKEIMIALSLGVPVYGSSSMGALRAAELTPYGMRGRGYVFEQYHSGRIIEDDEVAVLHASHEDDYLNMSVAMVDFRYAFDQALEQGELNTELRDHLIGALRNEHYHQRNWAFVYSKLLECGWSESAADALVGRFRSTSAKKQDALDLLNELVQHDDEKAAVPYTYPDLQTATVRSLVGRTISRPTVFYESWISDTDSLGKNLRSLPRIYLLHSLLARITALFEGKPARKAASAEAKAAVRIYADLHVTQAFHLNPPADVRLDECQERAIELCASGLDQLTRERATPPSDELRRNYLKQLAILDESQAGLEEVCRSYGIQINNIAAVVDCIIELEESVNSLFTQRWLNIDLTRDWWGLAVRSTGISACLPDPSLDSYQWILGNVKSDYFLARFGFELGKPEVMQQTALGT